MIDVTSIPERSARRASGTAPLTLFAMNNLHELGIQRAITWVVNAWRPELGRCHLSLHNRDGALRDFLEPHVVVHELDRIIAPVRGMATPFRVAAYVKLLRRLRPETVIAVNQFEALALCAAKRVVPDFRLVVSENCHVSSNIDGADRHRGWFGLYYRTLFAREYRNKADVVLTVAHEAADDLVEHHGIPRSRIRVVYNPVDVARVRRESETRIEHVSFDAGADVLVAASRLTTQKRIDVLLRAFARLRQRSTELGSTRLVVCGDGPERGALESLARSLGVEAAVSFVGFQSNPWAWMRRATLLVATSEWEGLPCTLIEGQAVGVPIVSSDCPSGPREILLEGEAGWLFRSGDPERAADALADAIRRPDERARRVAVATANLSRFDLATIVGQYAGLSDAPKIAEAR